MRPVSRLSFDLIIKLELFNDVLNTYQVHDLLCKDERRKTHCGRLYELLKELLEEQKYLKKFQDRQQHLPRNFFGKFTNLAPPGLASQHEMLKGEQLGFDCRLFFIVNLYFFGENFAAFTIVTEITSDNISFLLIYVFLLP